MKLRMALVGIALVVVALGAWALLFAGRSTKPMPFTGFTNGVVGPIAPVLAKVDSKSATAIRGWLAAGTNVASFLVTNHQRWPIHIDVYAGTRSEGATQIDTTPVVNAPNFGGFLLQPSQSATVQVAVLTSKARYKEQLYYFSYSKSEQLFRELSWRLQAIPERFGRPRSWPMHTLESDWLEGPSASGRMDRAYQNAPAKGAPRHR